MEGTNGRIKEASPSTVIKICHRKSTGGTSALEQKGIHEMAWDILTNPSYTLLRTPFLVGGPLYEMEKIDTGSPIFLGDEVLPPGVSYPRLAEELVQFWKDMWTAGYAAWDFELYLQPDGSVMLIDYDKFKKKIEPGFFVHPSFPRNFSELLKGFLSMV
jgi:hypothetical protein